MSLVARVVAVAAVDAGVRVVSQMVESSGAAGLACWVLAGRLQVLAAAVLVAEVEAEMVELRRVLAILERTRLSGFEAFHEQSE